VVQFVTHRWHFQAVDHLKHSEGGGVRSQSYGTCVRGQFAYSLQYKRTLHALLERTAMPAEE
jgi:hypothetical protein